MPTFEKLSALELNLTSPKDSEFVPACFRTGRFVVLDPIQETVLRLYYLGEAEQTDEEVGQLMSPPRAPSTVREIRLGAVRVLGSPYVQVRQIDHLRLSPRTKNAIYRKFHDISPEELLGMSDTELLSMRNFGMRSL